MERLIYTFETNGKGSRIFSFFGVPEYNVPLNITSTIGEARNTKWDWVTYDFVEPDEFTWEFLDDSLKLTFLGFSFEQTMNIVLEENEIILLIQNMDVTLTKE